MDRRALIKAIACTLLIAAWTVILVWLLETNPRAAAIFAGCTLGPLLLGALCYSLYLLFRD